MGPSGRDENQDKRTDPPVAMTTARMRLRHGTPFGSSEQLSDLYVPQDHTGDLDNICIPQRGGRNQ